MGTDKYKLDPNVVNMVSNGKGKNAGTAIARMFKDLGGIANDKQTRENDNKIKELGTKTKQLQYESVVDTLADNKSEMGYMASDYGSYKEYLADNNLTLKTKQGQANLEALEDKKEIEFYDKELVANEKYLRDNKLFMTEDGQMDMPEIRKQLSKGSHNLQLSQAFERKYNTKIVTPPKEKKILTISDQIKVQNEKKNKTDGELLEKDLIDVRANHKKLFGTDMSAAQELKYKNSGELPYMVYGTKNLKDKRKSLIDANIEVEKALTKLDKFSYAEIDSIVGFVQGRSAVIGTKEFFKKLEPKQKEILTILGHINSDKMHELYGAALTGGEIGRAKTWNLDTGQTTSSLITAINELRAKNTNQFKNNTHGVHGVPMEDMTFGQFEIPTKEESVNKQHKQETNQTPTSDMSRADKIKFLQGN